MVPRGLSVLRGWLLDADAGVVVDVDEVDVAADFFKAGGAAGVEEAEFALKVVKGWSGEGVVGVVPEDALDAVGVGV